MPTRPVDVDHGVHAKATTLKLWYFNIVQLNPIFLEAKNFLEPNFLSNVHQFFVFHKPKM